MGRPLPFPPLPVPALACAAGLPAADGPPPVAHDASGIAWDLQVDEHGTRSLRVGCQPGRRYTVEQSSDLVQWSALESLTPASLQEMAVGNDLLAMAYVEAFVESYDPNEKPPDWLVATRNDLLRRGNEAAPLLLQLFETHPLQQYRDEVLKRIEEYPTIDIKPFLAAAREYWRKNGTGTPTRTCYAISRLLSRRGIKEDLAILLEMRDHPSKEVGFVIEPDIVRMEKRLNGTLKQEEWTGRAPDGYSWDSSPRAPASRQLPPPSDSPQPSFPLPWILGGAVVVLAAGLLWFLRRRAKG